jgi:hypothetical protein
MQPLPERADREVCQKKKIDVEMTQSIPVSNIFIGTAEQFRMAHRHVGNISQDSAEETESQ